MKLALVFLLVVAGSWCFGEQQPDTPRIYCGEVLANQLRKICLFSNAVKRDAGWWLSADAMRALEGGRGKRGIIEECCYNPCSIEELQSYCLSFSSNFI
ncbi:hypothetical protein PYW07_015045 [Mythimna separata]|uniref:Insulin-like domain-containing protein n=1 Tax=Mythimna separata TaxID=271217 RepID=A0AAD7YY64_MYTSE|nr:hypothetical protein PYW07_015045 [Mythimna separata]